MLKKALGVRSIRFAMTKHKHTPSNSKVRRDALGGKRGNGLQRRRIRRPDARRIQIQPTKKKLTGVSGLVAFGAFAQKIGVDDELRRQFTRLKNGPTAVYGMPEQLRLLIDANVAGEGRIFGIEALSADPLFVWLAGGVVSSLDTLYRDLCRFDDAALKALEELVAKHGLSLLRRRRHSIVHLDIDTTVEPLFGRQQGALPGPNPHYHGRPSYHPLLARVAEVDAIVAAQLRPGDTGFGADVVPFIENSIDRVRETAGADTVVYVRIDGAADCGAVLNAITDRKAYFVTKAKMTGNLCAAVAAHRNWHTVDWGADGEPIQQVAEIPFVRPEWKHPYRVIAVRTRDRPSGKQIFLWTDLDYTVQVFITNEWCEAPIDVAHRYNLRAGIEPLIGELKQHWTMGKVPSQCFEANHAALLIKLLAFNLMRRFVSETVPALQGWCGSWLRRALVNVPGQLVFSGRQWTLRIPNRSMLNSWHN